jgi:S1-C subfamily serine protease
MQRVYWYIVLVSIVVLCRPVYPDQPPEELLRAVTRIRATIPETARTARLLGTEREGSGVVIDANGHVLTIGYLILEAETIELVGPDNQVTRATFVGYDHHSGFGLVRAETPPSVQPLLLGESSAIAVGDPILVASYGGSDAAQGVWLVARQEFAGYWEYLLEDAMFTAPPFANFGGAALIDRQGHLVGIGSLFTPVEIPGVGTAPGNMFIPIDRLKPILADLMATGRSATPPKPWLGVHAEEVHGRVFVRRTVVDGPAQQAGLQTGDLILQVGEQDITGLADFYRKIWARGAAGVEIPLRILQGSRFREITVHSVDRQQYLRLPARR